MLIGYARVSTDAQDAGLAAQMRDLQAAGVEDIRFEQVSSVARRPEFEAVMADLKMGDTLVVTKMDRLARSIVGLLQIVEDLNARGVALRILNLGGDVVDTKSATGRLMLSMLASFAQFEREIMLERQSEGIAKAKKEGKYKGRKPMSEERRRRLKDMKDLMIPNTQIAAYLGVHRATVQRILGATERT